jgi:nitrogen fixation protein
MSHSFVGRKALENPTHRVSCIQQQCGGGITWPNGYDFCPNFLRDDVPAVNVVEA